jgi:predicted TIM-barrel fold metal-dependent hydrolase
MQENPLMGAPLAALNDIEGDYLPSGLSPVVDAHVHVFPDAIFKAVWDWFGTFGWPVRYRISSENLIHYLLSRGIVHVVALQYAHKAGISRELNHYMAGLCRRFAGTVTGMATIFPGEPDAGAILEEAFVMGLAGVKLHTHVQCFDMNSPELEAVCDICVCAGKPLVIHAGQEPKSPAYKCDPYLLCSAEKLENLLRNFPGIRVCVPHLGMGEFEAYRRLIERYDTLWLDTTMAITDYFPLETAIHLEEMRTDRIMYGTDFPNIPYAWDREIKKLMAYPLDEKTLAAICGNNAANFFGFELQGGES